LQKPDDPAGGGHGQQDVLAQAIASTMLHIGPVEAVVHFDRAIRRCSPSRHAARHLRRWSFDAPDSTPGSKPSWSATTTGCGYPWFPSGTIRSASTAWIGMRWLAAMLAHERDLTALSDRAPFSVLCRYDADRERPAQLTALIREHSPVVQDVAFSAVRHNGRLGLAGELDGSNADRFGAVLHAALAENVRVVDLAEVTFLSAAILRVIAEAGDALGAGDVLTLNRPTPTIRHIIELVQLTASGAITVADWHGPG
jgi:anti-anti-sigma regulatory factor